MTKDKSVRKWSNLLIKILGDTTLTPEEKLKKLEAFLEDNLLFYRELTKGDKE